MKKESIQHDNKNIEDNRQLVDERMELLEVIKEMVDQRIDAKLKEYIGSGKAKQ